MSQYDITTLTSTVFEKEVAALMQPVASIEVLGEHGPLGADYLASLAVIPLIAQKTHTYYAPTVPYGDTLELPSRKGTVHIPQEVLSDYYRAIATSYAQSPTLKQFYFINFHSLNAFSIDSVSRSLSSKDFRIYCIDWWKCVASIAKEILEDKEEGMGHGGEMITSVLLYLDEKTIHLEKENNTEAYSQFGFYKEHLPRSSSALQVYGSFSDYTNNSSWGKLKGASKEKGKVLVEKAIEVIVQLIKESQEIRH